jgi:HAD superfamily hydrolase (TIGR01509 family)
VIKALILDFDGLILDTEEPVFQSWRELFQSFGVNLPLEAWAGFVGMSAGTFSFFDYLEDRLDRPVDRLALAPGREARELELIDQKPVMPGVMAYLDRARQLGLRMGVASSSSRRWVTGHLERLGLLERFSVIRAAEDVPHTKPDPALYLAVLDGLGVSPEYAIAFEDSPNGVLAARRAGLFCVAVPNPITRRLNLDRADLLLNSLEDLSLDELLSQVNHDTSRI